MCTEMKLTNIRIQHIKNKMSAMDTVSECSSLYEVCKLTTLVGVRHGLLNPFSFLRSDSPRVIIPPLPKPFPERPGGVNVPIFLLAGVGGVGGVMAAFDG